MGLRLNNFGLEASGFLTNACYFEAPNAISPSVAS